MHLASFYFSFYIFLKATPVTEQLTPVVYLHLALFSFSSYIFITSIWCIIYRLIVWFVALLYIPVFRFGIMEHRSLYSVFHLALSFFCIVIFMWTVSANKHIDGSPARRTASECSHFQTRPSFWSHFAWVASIKIP